MILRKIIKNNISLTCLWYIIDNWLAGKRLKNGNLKTTSGTRHFGMSLKNSIDYIDRVFKDYLLYGNLNSFSGNVAEIGPGDNLGVALCILANGAENVHAIDRWKPERNNKEQEQIYKALALRKGFTNLFTGPPNEKNIKGLTYNSGVPAEIFFKETNEKFDFIISRAVLEHLFDPLDALSYMFKTLNPGGMLIHRIDLRDHGMFSEHHPLTHLTINDNTWKLMTNNSGRPNRVLVPDYQRWLTSSDINGKIFISRLVGLNEDLLPQTWDQIPQDLKDKALTKVEAIKPKLSNRYRRMKDTDLAITGCILVAKKPFYSD